jgi:SAM-dependent methyltransferase
MNAAARILMHASRAFGRAARLFVWIAAGTLSREQLRAGITREWDEYNARPSDVCSDLMLWEERLAERAIRPGDRMLVVGSGSGRELLAFALRGHAVAGVEPAPAARALCRRVLAERGVNATIYEGFYEDAAIDGTFDVVLFSDNAYCYTPGRAVRVAMLRAARSALTPGGRVILSYAADRPRSAALARVIQLVQRTWRSDMRYEPGDDFYRTATGGSIGFIHTFAAGELEREVDAAGLEIADQTDFQHPAVVLRVPTHASTRAASHEARPETTAPGTPASRGR